MEINFLILLAATAVPLVIGFIWYNPKVFGTTWMRVSNVTPDTAKASNLGLLIALSAVFAFLIAFMMQSIVIHQYGMFGILATQPDFATAGSESSSMWEKFSHHYGQSYRTFKHGAFHGFLTGLFLITPIIATNALYEQKGFKYIAINGGYWMVSLALMGGVICAFS